MRKPLPEKIRNAPVLFMGSGLFLTAWLDLSSERISGWSEGRIPWSKVEAYADRFGLDEDQRDALHYHMRNLDNAYFKYQSEQKNG